jgi:hypothetical protein
MVLKPRVNFLSLEGLANNRCSFAFSRSRQNVKTKQTTAMTSIPNLPSPIHFDQEAGDNDKSVANGWAEYAAKEALRKEAVSARMSPRTVCAFFADLLPQGSDSDSDSDSDDGDGDTAESTELGETVTVLAVTEVLPTRGEALNDTAQRAIAAGPSTRIRNPYRKMPSNVLATATPTNSLPANLTQEPTQAVAAAAVQADSTNSAAPSRLRFTKKNKPRCLEAQWNHILKVCTQIENGTCDQFEISKSTHLQNNSVMGFFCKLSSSHGVKPGQIESYEAEVKTWIKK